MKFNYRSLLILSLILVSTNILANTVLLAKHTTIPVRLAQNINGNLDNQGDTIYFEVIEDVKVDNQVVVRKGVFVKESLIY